MSAVRQRPVRGEKQPKTDVADGTSGMLRFYAEDSPGLKVGPMPVLVMSLGLIASVFLLHIWGKMQRMASS